MNGWLEMGSHLNLLSVEELALRNSTSINSLVHNYYVLQNLTTENRGWGCMRVVGLATAHARVCVQDDDAGGTRSI